MTLDGTDWNQHSDRGPPCPLQWKPHAQAPGLRQQISPHSLGSVHSAATWFSGLRSYHPYRALRTWARSSTAMHTHVYTHHTCTPRAHTLPHVHT